MAENEPSWPSFVDRPFGMPLEPGEEAWGMATQRQPQGLPARKIQKGHREAAKKPAHQRPPERD